MPSLRDGESAEFNLMMDLHFPPFRCNSLSRLPAPTSPLTELAQNMLSALKWGNRRRDTGNGHPCQSDASTVLVLLQLEKIRVQKHNYIEAALISAQECVLLKGADNGFSLPQPKGHHFKPLIIPKRPRAFELPTFRSTSCTCPA